MTLPLAEPAPDLRTIADLPFLVSGRYPKPLLTGRCRGQTIVGLSSKEWFERIRDLALGLLALGVRRGDRVVIMSESRPEWLMTDLAVLAIGAVTVPIYPTLSAGQARYILEDAGARVAFVSSSDELEKVQQVRHAVPSLEAVVLFGELPHASPSIIPFDELTQRGHARMVAEWGIARQFHDTTREIAPSDLATIIYTSGTTGQPKGVMLSHGNLVANLLAGQTVLPLDQSDVLLSFLPLSHSFERMVAYICLANGVTIIFAEGMETIARDIVTVKPTIMTGVPRVFEKFQARIMEKGHALAQPRRTLFHWGINVALARAAAEMHGGKPGVRGVLPFETTFAERLVWSKIRENVGGRLRVLASGSAPLPVSVAEFFHGIGLPITEGYGLTETAPILSANSPGHGKIGTVGRAIPGVELKIAPDGEILARGPNIMVGYYNKPEATAEVLRDGWLHTGDVGTLDADGFLSITDRKKDILVTSGGKKIAPQPIESILKRSPLIAEAVVLGDRRKFASALIVPDFTTLEQRLKDLGRPIEARDALVRRPDVVALYEEIVDALNLELSQFERIKKIRLLPREFSIASGELTPTLKVKRKVIEEQWRDDIEKMYGHDPS